MPLDGNINGMNKITTTKYQCETCHGIYDEETKARRCEEKEITGDRGADIGDTVLITSGEGSGKKAVVESIHLKSMYWGHYSWERYWHTISVTAEVVDGFGGRNLTFDSYKMLNEVVNPEGGFVVRKCDGSDSGGKCLGHARLWHDDKKRIALCVKCSRSQKGVSVKKS